LQKISAVNPKVVELFRARKEVDFGSILRLMDAIRSGCAK